MGKVGHILTGAAFASIPLALDQYALGFGILAGVMFPDAAEFSSYNHETGETSRLIEHRTITHWFAPYLFVLLISVAMSFTHDYFLILCGLALGALHHILIDAFSPSGVPVKSYQKSNRMAFFLNGRTPELHPGLGCSGCVDKRAGYGRFYTTGTLSELIFGVFAVFTGLVIALTVSLF